jgi:pyruvate/2-oxoglutarate dehydrogenase complex dihydrolipoamide dehydrogenase (E3) component
MRSAFDVADRAALARRRQAAVNGGVGFLMKKNKVTVIDGDGQAARQGKVVGQIA